ncbi:MAG TPA: hypothetical protein VGF32_12230 [Streptosporangiaceae bacterium]
MTTAIEDVSAEALLAQAQQADQAAADLESRADGGEDIPLADVRAHRDRAGDLRWRARSARSRAAQEAGRQRMEALRQLGEDIRAEAAQATARDLRTQLAELAERAGAIRQEASRHDQSVRELRSRAENLGVTGPAPGGPRASCGHVAVTLHGVQVGDSEVIPVRHVEAMIGAAVAGQQPDAPSAVVTRTPPPRPPHAVLGRGGMITPVPEITEVIQGRIDTGDVIRLTPAEIDAWYGGELDVTSVSVASRAAAQVTAARAAEQARRARISAGHAATRERNEALARERAARNDGRSM